MAYTIENVRFGEREDIIRLLDQAGLLTDDLSATLSNFVLAKDGKNLIGVAGLESFGEVGLLRSVAVVPDYQGKGIAARLTERLVNTAVNAHVQELYLITNTAERYFERHGFKAVNRTEVPVSIQQTQQFSSLCPSSAVVMHRKIFQ